jgi:hypothetical protein
LARRVDIVLGAWRPAVALGGCPLAGRRARHGILLKLELARGSPAREIVYNATISPKEAPAADFSQRPDGQKGRPGGHLTPPSAARTSRRLRAAA